MNDRGYNPYRNADGTFANGPSAMQLSSWQKVSRVYGDTPNFYGKETVTAMKNKNESAARAITEAREVLHTIQTSSYEQAQDAADEADDAFLDEMAQSFDTVERLSQTINKNSAFTRAEQAKFDMAGAINKTSNNKFLADSVAKDLTTASKELKSDLDRFVKTSVKNDGVSAEFATNLFNSALSAMNTYAASLSKLVE